MKKNTVMRQASLTEARRRLFILLALFLVLSGVLFFIYKNKQTVFNLINLSAHVKEMKWWMVERKNHLQNELTHHPLRQAKEVNATPLVENKNNTEQKIHFEFYNTLPNMQVNLPVPINKTFVKNEQTTGPNKKLATPSHTLVALSNSIKPTNKFVINANELEQELSAQIKQKSYVIQLGVFHYAQAAEQYRQSLFTSGLTAHIVKTGAAKKQIYRVQLGPFDKEKVKIAKHELQKKGIHGIIRNS